MDNTFADWLILKMQERGVNQSELARRAGITRQAVSFYMTGKSKAPSEKSLLEIARVLKVPPEEIYRAAGLLPPAPIKDEVIYKIENLYHSISEEKRIQLLEYAEFLSAQEEKQKDKKIYKRGITK